MAADAFDELLHAFSQYFDNADDSRAPILLTSRDVSSLNTFEELLCVFDPYFGNPDDGPAFHRFGELPLELRYEVYEQYFIDNKKCLACFEWPDNHGEPSLSFTKPRGSRWERSSPFLPNLCLVNHTLKAEVASSLVGPVILYLNKKLAKELMVHKGSSTFVLSMARKLILMDINEDLSTNGKDDITLRSRILSASKNLQELHFASMANISARSDLSRGLHIIEDSLRKLDTKLISGMRRLQKLHFHGFINLHKSTTKEKPDEKKLQNFKKIGKSIKARFQKRHCEVEVQLHLYMGERVAWALYATRNGLVMALYFVLTDAR